MLNIRTIARFVAGLSLLACLGAVEQCPEDPEVIIIGRTSDPTSCPCQPGDTPDQCMARCP